MKNQGYNARLDDSLGAKHGKKSQSLKDRRNESKAMSKKDYGHSYGADKSMSYRHKIKVVKHNFQFLWKIVNAQEQKNVLVLTLLQINKT